MTSSNGNIFRVTGPLWGESTGPLKIPVTRTVVVFYDQRMNSWADNRDAGDLRHHRAHYDVIVMRMVFCIQSSRYPTWSPVAHACANFHANLFNTIRTRLKLKKLKHWRIGVTAVMSLVALLIQFGLAVISMRKDPGILLVLSVFGRKDSTTKW